MIVSCNSWPRRASAACEARRPRETGIASIASIACVTCARRTGYYALVAWDIGVALSSPTRPKGLDIPRPIMHSTLYDDFLHIYSFKKMCL